MDDTRSAAARSLWPVWGLSVVLLLFLVVEAVAVLVGVVPVPGGYWVGFFSTLLVVFGVGYVVYWIPGFDLSTARYQRINRWWVAGASGYLLVNVGFMATLPTESAFQVFGWIRWAIGFGGGIGLLIGLFEARAIEREVTAERSRVRRAQLRRERDRLEEFASVVSHDLRNPLSVVRGRVDLAKQAHTDDEHLAAVEPALDRMDEIIEETLTLAREGKTVDDADDVPLDDCVRECWSRVDTADATLSVDGSLTVRADRDRLSHVFENLFRNAIEHGGSDVAVRVGPLGGQDGFYVEDDGIGIPAADIDRVRETGVTSSADGTGFGLAIVERIVEAHGWELRIDDGAEGGTRFEISGVDRRS
ncbi:membrane associated histidine kinase [Halorubrum distributum JCM 9100]|uniref:histidine kinase n=2 Tax=Halorubrum distributum TaxID=29283 RepID=M0ERE5_9EURY|nr:HAMP domain-containing sensor histidine kinase [Halorubrum distributum]ELZ49457.1 membrane associated histidine kinase [Halorubrum distributum JCM 9100]ELZ57308.1 membrane associated histidine kinase [Halorubrum distributum JCM 10118]